MKLSTLLNDHVDIKSRAHAILFASEFGGIRSRKQLTLDLRNEIKALFKAEDSLLNAMRDKEQVRQIISNLQGEHGDIEYELNRLAESEEQLTVEWTSGFEDFILLLDEHFEFEQRELFPQLETLLSGPRASASA